MFCSALAELLRSGITQAVKQLQPVLDEGIISIRKGSGLSIPCFTLSSN